MRISGWVVRLLVFLQTTAFESVNRTLNTPHFDSRVKESKDRFPARYTKNLLVHIAPFAFVKKQNPST